MPMDELLPEQVMAFRDMIDVITGKKSLSIVERQIPNSCWLREIAIMAYHYSRYEREFLKYSLKPIDVTHLTEYEHSVMPKVGSLIAGDCYFKMEDK